MTAEDRIQPEVLLQHRAFVRRVSRALVADPHLALDLEQEAWLAAIEHPPRRVEALLRWFRVAIRNIASKRRRGDSRRTGRERRAARPEATDATDAIVHRLAVQREVVDAVLALERHYRAVIVLRYYEDLGPAAISARLALPLRTVKFRLQRAVELLRSRLGEHDRHDWFRSGLLALAGAPQASLVPATAGVTGAAGVTIMGAKVSVGMLCAIALSSVAVWLGSELLKDEGLQGGTTAMPPPAASTPGIRGETRDGNAVGREVVMGAVPAALAAEQPPPGGEGDAAALPATGAVTLKLQDALTEAPIASASMRLLSERRFADTRVNGAGQIVISAGIWEAAIRADGHEPLTLAPFTVRAGETTDLGAVSLTPGSGRIEGTIQVPPAVARPPFRVELTGAGRNRCPQCAAGVNAELRDLAVNQALTASLVTTEVLNLQAIELKTAGQPAKWRALAAEPVREASGTACPACGYASARSVRMVELGQPFSFANLASGSYALQVIDAEGRRLGKVQRVALERGQYVWLGIDVAALLDVEFELRDAFGRPFVGCYTAQSGESKVIDGPYRYQFFDADRLLATAEVRVAPAPTGAASLAALGGHFQNLVIDATQVQVSLVAWQEVKARAFLHAAIGELAAQANADQRVDRERHADDRLVTPPELDWPAAVALPARAIWPDVHVVSGLPSQHLVLRVQLGHFTSDAIPLDLASFDGRRTLVVLRAPEHCSKAEAVDGAACQSCHP